MDSQSGKRPDNRSENRSENRLGSELKELKGQILAMGALVEQAVDAATFALGRRDPKLFETVHRLEERINEAHIAVDNACVNILARQSPVAADLRMILAIIKINTDLERMGDQALNICQNAEHYIKGAALPSAIETLSQMAGLVRAIVRQALDAFMAGDTTLATNVIASDDEIDELRDTTFRELIEVMKSDPEKVRGALDLLLISRNLERLADHATNIGEDVIFVDTGADIRHRRGETK